MPYILIKLTILPDFCELFILWKESKHLWQYFLRSAYTEKFSAINNDLGSFYGENSKQ
jgi:hypothetical protein